MVQTRSVSEIRLVTEGFLALTPFHYSLNEWELTKAGRRANKIELKQKKKDKLSRQANIREKQAEYLVEPMAKEMQGDQVVADLCKGVIQEAINELSREESCSAEASYIAVEYREEFDVYVAKFCRGLILEAIDDLRDEEGHILEAFMTTKEDKDELEIAAFCRQMILEAINELCKEESQSTEAYGNITTDFEKEIQEKIESLEKGEGDVGRPVTSADLVETKDYGELQRHVDVTSGEPDKSAKASLDEEEPIKPEGAETGTDVEILTETDKKGSTTEKAFKEEYKAERKREEKERKERKKLEKEQTKATKKYFKMIDEAMRSRSIVLKLFWEKTVEENKRQLKRQERLRQKELMRERLEQKAQEKKQKKFIIVKGEADENSTLPLERSISANLQKVPSDILQTEESRVTKMDDDGNNNHVPSKKDGTIQAADEKITKKTKFGSRILRFYGRLYGEIVF